VLVVLGMSLAFLGAGNAHLSAAGNLGSGRRRVVLGLTSQDATGRLANVGTVQAEPHAPAHLRDVVLRQVCIGAGCAALQAGEALVDAAGEQIAIDLGGARMSLQDLLRQRRVSQCFSFRPWN
jgi:hypothetical protein